MLRQHYGVIEMETNTVMMPRALTAENGAKGLLSGEFKEVVLMQCPRCDGEGWEDEESGEECYECTGAGEYALKVLVSWTTIKEIYAIAVKHLAT